MRLEKYNEKSDIGSSSEDVCKGDHRRAGSCVVFARVHVVKWKLYRFCRFDLKFQRRT